MSENEKRSDAWHMIELLGQQNRRMFVALVTVLALLAGTIGGFIWYLYQYDFDTYYVESNEGHANYIGNDGDICNGEGDSTKEST